MCEYYRLKVMFKAVFSVLRKNHSKAIRNTGIEIGVIISENFEDRGDIYDAT